MSTTVRTTCTLEAFVNCGPYTALEQLGVTCSDVRITSLVVEVEMDSDGVLKMLPVSPEMDGTWCDYVCAARDLHEQNMEVFLDDAVGGRAAVRTTRRLVLGEELFVWFEESLARQRNIAILSPANIRGQDEYLCTLCGAVFQRPNPLKSHIRYHCSARQSTPVTSDRSTPWINTDFPLFLPAPPASWFSSCMMQGFPADWNALSHTSAYNTLAARPRRENQQAMTSYADDVTGNTRGPVPNAATWWLDYLQQILHTDNDSGTRMFKLRDVTSGATSGVTKVSGDEAMNSTSDEHTKTTTTTTSSQRVSTRDKPLGGGGYVCAYCGKLYSRRYGLKIHVRTHTGFKPLQCSVCRRAFADPSNLNKHIRLHVQSSADGSGGGSAPYRCCHCGKVLVRRRDLDRHVRAKHPDQLPPSSDDVSTNGADTVLVTSSEYVSADDDDIYDGPGGR